MNPCEICGNFISGPENLIIQEGYTSEGGSFFQDREWFICDNCKGPIIAMIEYLKTLRLSTKE